MFKNVRNKGMLIYTSHVKYELNRLHKYGRLPS